MLCGQGVVAIWNGISEVGRLDFYEWHIREHMPERTGIPGFRRGRRYRAIARETHPEFFTLYEVDSFEVVGGQDYKNRLNSPSHWTKKATSHFTNTSRSLARVLSSAGPGSGGVLATIRFGVSKGEHHVVRTSLSDIVTNISRLPLVTGAHLCLTDDDASGVKTAESEGRKDYTPPPKWFVLIEACTAEALEEPVRLLSQAALIEGAEVGRYAFEYARLKTDWAAG
jgi:hypothetical protein